MVMSAERIRKVVDIYGVVQGVGFRPAVCRLALESSLGGSVQNRSKGVRLVLEGDEAELGLFLRTLPDNLPPQVRIERIEELLVEPVDDHEMPTRFRILDSPEYSVQGIGGDEPRISFPPDLAVCADCMSEVKDPYDRRYGYPFTTCTNCGPRYTVINGMPYDRERTTLAEFPLCAVCRAEYEDYSGRRFHAESMACPECGPRLIMTDREGSQLEGIPLSLAREKLSHGEILGVRGIGGFLLAVDAYNREALKRLRERKQRPHKPFAVMVRNLEILRHLCEIPAEAERLLLSSESPIVILDRRKDIDTGLSFDLLAPDIPTLGVMLPTSPLHWLLFEPLAGDPTPAFDLLVMTSGNRRAEPICVKNDEAYLRLGDIADSFLLHDREINLRADDSLCVIQQDKPQVWRRARGFAPNRLYLKEELKRCVLAMGAELKNTIAVGQGEEIVLSPHVGDLETPEAINGLEQLAECFPVFLHKTPEVVAVDLHPDMHSTILGRQLARHADLEVIEVQHHFAHAASVMAEYGCSECLALVFDGTGLGTDHTIWGAELIHAQTNTFRRLATFAPVALPGGDTAVREPFRQVVARFLEAGIVLKDEMLARFGLSSEEVRIWAEQIKRGLNAPMSHAAGRVFDAFSAGLGFSPGVITYEGQAAILLETAACSSLPGESVPELRFSLRDEKGMMLVDWSEAFVQLFAQDAIFSRDAAWAMAVHRAVAKAALAMVEYGFASKSTRTVALSGGVFMNRILTTLVSSMLEERGIEVLIHREIPPNDGGISAGQAYIAGRT